MVELKKHLISFHAKLAWMDTKLSSPVQNLWDTISIEQSFRVFEDQVGRLDNGFAPSRKGI